MRLERVRDRAEVVGDKMVKRRREVALRATEGARGRGRGRGVSLLFFHVSVSVSVSYLFCFCFCLLFYWFKIWDRGNAEGVGREAGVLGGERRGLV